jgi:hypothetical protein
MGPPWPAGEVRDALHGQQGSSGGGAERPRPQRPTKGANLITRSKGACVHQYGAAEVRHPGQESCLYVGTLHMALVSLSFVHTDDGGAMIEEVRLRCVPASGAARCDVPAMLFSTGGFMSRTSGWT